MYKGTIHKRFLAWMLAFAIVFGMVPLSLAADEDEAAEEPVVQEQSENQQDEEETSIEEEEETPQEPETDSEEDTESAEPSEESTAGQDLSELALALVEQLVTYDSLVTSAHIATYVGVEPDFYSTFNYYDIVWDTYDASAFDEAYALVSLNGTGYVDEDDNVGTALKCYVEVIPENTVFFSDIQFGTATSSDAYDAVANYLNEQNDALLNTVNHQMYSAGGWGLVSAFKNKGAGSEVFTVDLNNKLHTGNYASGSVEYYLPITEAGTYTIATGHAEYWSGQSRTFNIFVDVGDTTHTIASAVGVSASSTFAEESGSFAITEAEAAAGAEVKLRIVSTSNDVTLSYIIVSEGGEQEEPTPSSTTHFATYVGELPELPKTLGGKAVTWDEMYAIQFGTPYDRVTVKGTYNESGESVSVYVEVIPKDLVYFVDEGNTEETPVFQAITALAKETMRNEVTTQSIDDGDWGLVTTDATKKVVDTSDKYNSGIYGKYNTAGTYLEYEFYLEAGTYTIVTGHMEWWNSRSATVSVKDETEDVLTSNSNVSLGSQYATAINPLSFTITEAQTITLLVTANGSNAPVISWIGISEGDITDAFNSDFISIIVNGNDVQSDNVNGLTFKGFGVLSGNSTSDLLMDYKAENEEAYWELMNILFGGDYPIMTHVKIEMGNDRNNSTGPESATMRSADEEANVLRNSGWLLAADAKSINEEVKVSILRWNAPVWASTTALQYQWYKETILAAYNEWHWIIDYINPNVNEHWGGSDDVTRTIEFYNLLQAETSNSLGVSDEAAEAFRNIKLIVSDEVSTVSASVAEYLKSNSSFYEAVSVVGFHYSPYDDANGGMKWWAEEEDQEVWNSEAQATFSNSAFRPSNNTSDYGDSMGGTGSALEMANTFVKGFVQSRRTHVIYQPAIGSFYEGAQYSFKELVSARDPWSGWIHYDAGLVILQHFSQFAVAGWENEDNTNGIWRFIPEASVSSADGTNPVNGRNGGANYVTLASPTKDDFSTVIVNDSEETLNYRIAAVAMNLDENQKLEMWETTSSDGIGEENVFNVNYKQMIAEIEENADGYYYFTVQPFSIVTVTTLDQSDNDEVTTALPVEGERSVLDTDETGRGTNTQDNYLYADDFEYEDYDFDYIASRGGDTGAIARYTHTLNGAFEVYKSDKANSGSYVLRQQLDTNTYGVGGAWNGGDAVTVIGDFRWSNYKASVDVYFESTTTNNYAAIGIRYMQGTQTIDGSAYSLRLWRDGTWKLYRFGTSVASGSVGAVTDWTNIAVQGAGATITAYIDGELVATYVDSTPQLSGRVELGTGYYFTQFDNLEVTTVDGYDAYYEYYLDDQETYDLEGNVVLVYDGTWSHVNGQGMYVYQRSNSSSSTTGASVTLTFTGTGIDLFGATSSATLKAVVDGGTLVAADAVQSGDSMRNFYSLRGLPYGEHTVTLTLVSGSINIDMVGVIGGRVSANEESVAAAEKMLEIANAIDENDVNNTAALAEIENILEIYEDVSLENIDAQGLAQFITRLGMLLDDLNATITDIESISLATYAGKEPKLPDVVTVTYDDGDEDELEVIWDLSSVSFNTAYQSITVSGRVGYGHSTTATIEVVPEGLMYFIDSNAYSGGDKTLGYDSPIYTIVSNLVDLQNGAPDQVYISGTNTWGVYGSAINQKDAVSGDYSKLTTTGYYADNNVNDYIGYTFENIPAGKYEVTIGLYDWWSNSNRNVDVRVYQDDDYTTIAENVYYSSNSGANTYSFIVTDECTLKIALYAKYAQAPMISYLELALLGTLEEIEVTTLPDKTAYYLDEAFDATGLVVHANYSDGSAVDITEHASLSDFDSSSVGEKVITVSYLDYSTEFTVTVSKKSSGVITDAPPATSGTNINETETTLSSGEEAITINGGESELSFNSDGSVTITEELLAGYENAIIIAIPCETDSESDGIPVLVDGNGNVVVISAASDGMMYALIDEAGEYSVKSVTVSFADASEHWAADNIAFVAAHGLFQGMDDEHFAPDLSMTRAMFVTVLARLGSVDLNDYTTSSFDDVEAESWYNAAVSWAAEAGIVNGVGNGMFAPEQEVTREQMAVMLVAYLKYAGYSLPSTTEAVRFADAESISSWAAEAVTAMQQAGILTGRTDGSFDPQGIATRGEVATLFTRVIEALLA